MEVIEDIKGTSLDNDIVFIFENALCFKKPTNIADLPALTNVNEEHFTICDMKSIKQYFKSFTDETVDVSVIEGFRLDTYASYFCDYCITPIQDQAYYCYHCHKDMCLLCHSETSEEIALKNGAKHYHKRKDALDLCRAQNKLKPRSFTKIGLCVRCDVCRKYVDDDKRYYSKSNGDNSYDVCLECYDEKKHSDLVLLDKEDINSYAFGKTNFESMLYWFPVIIGKENTKVLININKDSANFNKVCLSADDDHDRSGYYMIEYTLDETIAALNKIIAESDDLYSSFYETPIHKLMISLNIPVYYG